MLDTDATRFDLSKSRSFPWVVLALKANFASFILHIWEKLDIAHRGHELWKHIAGVLERSLSEIDFGGWSMKGARS
jgi:hypothetical protein